MRHRLALLLWAVVATACGPTAPSDDSIDTLDYVLGAPETWPRFGPTNHHQHQTVEGNRVCWTKYTLPWSYECWRWDGAYLYHDVDHAIDGNRRWEHYRFSDGRWLPRRLAKRGTWTLELPQNRMTWFDAECHAEPERLAPYRVEAWYAGSSNAGGDLGVRDVLVLSYQPNFEGGEPDTQELFWFGKGVGWFKWTRGGVSVAFNQFGGVARTPAPLCARDFQF